MLGLRTSLPNFSKYADLTTAIRQATAYADDVRADATPARNTVLSSRQPSAFSRQL
jgi:ketopantoate hydroxymethyltransferase